MPSDSLRLALETLERIDAGTRADRALERALRASPGLTSTERGEVARRVLGISCLRGRLDYLASGLIPEASPAAARLATWLVTEEHLTPEDARLGAGLEPTALPGLRALEDEPAWPDDPVERLAAERSLPAWLARLWTEQLGQSDADALAAATNRPGPITVRANTLKFTREALARALAAEDIEAVPGSLSPDALHLRGRPNIFGSAAWRGGLFEVQDEGSQLIARLARPGTGQKVVDFCAGAGGKTLALAALMRNRGRLLALDIDARRLADLRPRLARAGVGIVESLLLDPQADAPTAALDADVVLVDAPCSSLGTLRRGPDVRWHLRPEEVAAFPERQLAILRRAATCVRPGGRLVYATCTLNLAENEEVALRFESAADGFEREVPDLNLRPDREGCDGFFAAAWKRTGDHA